MNYEFSLHLKVYDPQSLLAEAMAHDDAQYIDPKDWYDAEGAIDIPFCLRMLLDPGSLSGCEIFDSAAEGE